ncbi:MAG: PilZ domain-containing protein, partial [Tepidisphaerales bacterium]
LLPGRPRAGRGRSLNIGSGGVLFTTEEPPAAGQAVEVSIDWPACIDGTCALQLVAMGQVVRSDAHQAAVQFERHEFRTRGKSHPGPE